MLNLTFNTEIYLLTYLLTYIADDDVFEGGREHTERHGAPRLGTTPYQRAVQQRSVCMLRQEGSSRCGDAADCCNDVLI